MTAYPPPPDRATWVQPPPERRRRTWLVLLAVGIVVVVLGAIGGGIVAVTALTRVDPRDVVVAYLDAIASGDVAAANAFTAPGAPLPDPTSMVGAATIAVQAVELDSAGSETERTYLATFVLDGTQRTVGVEIGRADADGEWRVLESLARELAITTTAPSAVTVTVGGFAVEPEAVPLMPVMLYPGSYTADVATQEQLEADDLAVVVADQDLQVRVEPRATAGAVETVTALAEATLAACLQESTRVYADCDEVDVISDAASAAEVAWRLEGDVTVQTDPTSGPWAMTIAATAVATYADDSGATAEQRIPVETDAQVVTPSGEVTATFDWTSDL